MKKMEKKAKMYKAKHGLILHVGLWIGEQNR